MSEAPNVKRKRTKAASESSPWEWVEEPSDTEQQRSPVPSSMQADDGAGGNPIQKTTPMNVDGWLNDVVRARPIGLLRNPPTAPTTTAATTTAATTTTHPTPPELKRGKLSAPDAEEFLKSGQFPSGPAFPPTLPPTPQVPLPVAGSRRTPRPPTRTRTRNAGAGKTKLDVDAQIDRGAAKALASFHDRFAEPETPPDTKYMGDDELDFILAQSTPEPDEDMEKMTTLPIRYTEPTAGPATRRRTKEAASKGKENPQVNADPQPQPQPQPQLDKDDNKMDASFHVRFAEPTDVHDPEERRLSPLVTPYRKGKRPRRWRRQSFYDADILGESSKTRKDPGDS